MATISGQRIVFSDVNPDVHSESQFERVSNEEAVRKSIESIILTPYGSRPFRRQYGSKLNYLLFEPVDSTTAAKIQVMITDLIKLWETRVTELNVIVLPDVPNQQYYVELRYKIVELGNKMVAYKFNVSK